MRTAARHPMGLSATRPRSSRPGPGDSGAVGEVAVAMSGVFKQCGCRDAVTGRRSGARCTRFSRAGARQPALPLLRAGTVRPGGPGAPRRLHLPGSRTDRAEEAWAAGQRGRPTNRRAGFDLAGSRNASSAHHERAGGRTSGPNWQIPNHIPTAQGPVMTVFQRCADAAGCCGEDRQSPLSTTMASLLGRRLRPPTSRGIGQRHDVVPAGYRREPAGGKSAGG